jgi:predicted small lipoprotein YifL
MRPPIQFMSRHRITVLFVAIALLATLAAGCGKKGPLYLPDQPRPAPTTPSTP